MDNATRKALNVIFDNLEEEFQVHVVQLRNELSSAIDHGSSMPQVKEVVQVRLRRMIEVSAKFEMIDNLMTCPELGLVTQAELDALAEQRRKEDQEQIKSALISYEGY